MKTLILSFLTIFSITVGAADLKTTFRSMDKLRKGPFDYNMLQGSRSRVIVNQGNPSGDFQFQAAFRNDTARALAEQYQFFVGNLFTTNYYELMGEYVYNDRYGSHGIDHQALINVGSRAEPKASAMIRSWILEKHYVSQSPGSALHRGFRLRGISGSEFEQAYSVSFFNFYLSVLEDESKLLPAMLLAKGSPILDSNLLERARTQIAAAYDSALLHYGKDQPAVRRLYQLRNFVHNQLSSNVISVFDEYAREFSWMVQGDSRILETRDLLRAYYSVSAAKVAEIAKKSGQGSVMTAADLIAKSGFTVERGLALSKELAKVRSDLLNLTNVPTAKKAETLVLLFTGTQYLNKELTNLNGAASQAVVLTVLNLIYVEGFLLHDNWEYFATEAQGTQNPEEWLNQLSDVMGIANDTLTQSMAPSFEKWLSIEPKMQSFVDQTMKSSALNTAALVAKKIKR